MNIVFDLGGVVVAYDRAALLAELCDDPATHAAMAAVIDGDFEWAAIDSGILSEHDAVARAALRAGLEGLQARSRDLRAPARAPRAGRPRDDLHR